MKAQMSKTRKFDNDNSDRFERILSKDYKQKHKKLARALKTKNIDDLMRLEEDEWEDE